MLTRFLTQLSIFIAVTILIALSLKHLGVPLFYGIPLGILTQFGFYYAFITSLNAYVELRNKQLENERIKEFTLQGLDVICPCHLKKTEFVPIVLNTENKYNCASCQKNISVYIAAETALVTDPIVSPQVPAIIPTIE